MAAHTTTLTIFKLQRCQAQCEQNANLGSAVCSLHDGTSHEADADELTRFLLSHRGHRSVQDLAALMLRQYRLVVRETGSEEGQ